MPVVRRFLLLLLGLIMVSPASAQVPASGPAPNPVQQPTAAPMPSGPMFVVSYFETAPAATASAARVLHRFALDTRKADGNQGVLVLREARRPGRFALFEAWRDKAALDNVGLKGIDGLRDHLAAQLIAPFDTRPCVPLEVAAAAGAEASGPREVYVLTHVDVIPTFKDQTIAAIRDLAAASRREKGNLRFDAVQQPNRPNHMFLVEGWSDRAAYDAHVTAEPTQSFRTRLMPMQGALYDERLYEAVK
jgi:quinol monooxygenase YgiN